MKNERDQKIEEMEATLWELRGKVRDLQQRLETIRQDTLADAAVVFDQMDRKAFQE